MEDTLVKIESSCSWLENSLRNYWQANERGRRGIDRGSGGGLEYISHTPPLLFLFSSLYLAFPPSLALALSL